MAKERKYAIPCVIPCGGNSTRLGTNYNKCLLEVYNRPVLSYVVDFWQALGIEDFVFIVGGDSAGEVVRCIAGMSLKRPVVVDREATTNLTKAVGLVKPHINDRFILALGDCVNSGSFVSPWQVDFGVGVCLNTIYELRKSYLVSTIGSRVATLVEKPKEEIGLCGMGTYFLHKRIFDYIERLSLPDQATSVDLTGALQLAMGWGETILPIYYVGGYINVTYPADIETLKEVVK